MTRKKVLLISSDPRFFEVPENLFQSRGCDVFAISDGAEALSFIIDHGVDLVISRGEPTGASIQTLHQAIGTKAHIIVVPTPGGDFSSVLQLPNVQFLQGSGDGKALLRLSSKLLDVPDRKYISILVQVRLTKPKPTTIFGKSRDLSEGGILIETTQLLGIYDQVVVSFLIPGADRMIQTDALVVREVPKADGGKRYGLRFLSVTDEDRTIIAEFIVGKNPT